MAISTIRRKKTLRLQSPTCLVRASIHLNYAFTYIFGRIDCVKASIIHTISSVMFIENHVIVNYAPKSLFSK